MRCYLFDLDGTVCNIDHRLHFIVCPEGMTTGQTYLGQNPATVFRPDWDSFFAACVGDAPIRPICDLLHDLSRSVTIIFVTGRSDAVRKQTQDWLLQHVSARAARAPLYMRPDGDHRPDHVLKAEILDEILGDGYQPIMAFEDRAQVVKMWRERGVVCAQVAEGDF